MQLRKVFKRSLVVGLLIILLVMVNAKAMGLKNRAIILLSKYRLLLPYIVAQAKHETGNFKSEVYLTDHNMFGMKFINGARGQVATSGLPSPEGDHYAHYASDTDSLNDLLLWFDYEKFPTSVTDAGQYATELKNRNYFTAGLSSYVKALLGWLSIS